jgi:hypothetical protein
MRWTVDLGSPVRSVSWLRLSVGALASKAAMIMEIRPATDSRCSVA